METLIQVCFIMVMTLFLVIRDLEAAIKQLDVKKLIQYRDLVIIGFFGMGMLFFYIAMQGLLPLIIAGIVYVIVGFIMAFYKKRNKIND